MDVFDTIRDHRQGMKIGFDQINVGFEEISIDYHTGGFRGYLEKEQGAED